MKVYVVLESEFFEDFSFDRIVRMFLNESDAEEFSESYNGITRVDIYYAESKNVKI